MTFRPAVEADIPQIAALLRANIQTSMFPLANLNDHGLGSDAPRGMKFWLREDGSGAYGETNEGMALPQMPGAAPGEWAALRAMGCGAALIGALGEAGQVRAMLAAWDHSDRAARHDADEPGFTLDLADLVRAEAHSDASLEPINAMSLTTVIGWRTAYHVEVLGTPPTEAPALAENDVAAWRLRDSHRVLMVGGTPAALTGFNATVEDVVQIGGVYTPPEARARGLARVALAMHLMEARARGVRRAVLFSASEAATRAYEAVGFRRAGSFAMVLFDAQGGRA